MLVPQRLRDEHLDRLSGQLRGGVSEQPLHVLVGQDDAAAGVNDDHRVGRPHHQAAETLLGLDPGGDVTGDGHGADDGARDVMDR